MEKLLLIDGNSLLFRAFFGQGSGARLTSTQGVPTGALHTFMMMYLKYLKELAPTHVCVAFDTAEKTFRHDEFADYKGKRPPLPEDLAEQMPILRELLDAMGVPRYELAGYEADDLIGTYARIAEAEGMEVEILTGDKDTFQCITDKTHVIMPPFKASMGAYTRYDRETFRARYGVEPEQFVDVKALMGDSSDNIPGVPGVGEKTALKLISEYGSLDEVYAKSAELKGKLKERIEDNREQAYLSQYLSRINVYVPLPENYATPDVFQLAPPPSAKELQALLSELNMSQLLSRMKLDFVDLNTADEGQSSGLKIHEVELSFSAFVKQISGLTRFLEDKQIYFAFSSSAKPYKTLKQAAPLLTEDAYLGLSFTLNDEGRSHFSLKNDLKILHCFAPCPTEMSEREQLASALYESKLPMIVYRSKDAWREALLDPRQEVFDVETAAYLAADKGDLKDFSSLCVHTLEKVQLTEPEDEKGWARMQLGHLPALFENLNPLIEDKKLAKLAKEVDMPLARTLGLMERRGFLVNPQVLDDLHLRFAENTKILEESIYASVGHAFNINSPKQLAVVLYEELGLPSGKKGQNKQYSTDLSELQRLRNAHPVIDLIMAYRAQAKLDSTFIVGLKKYIAAEDGRIHSYFSQNYTSTGRLSSKDPNLQNIPVRHEMGKEIRRAFEAKAGYLLLDADYSQIELRLLAHLADEPAMIEAFSQDKDIHRRTAAHLFSIAEDTVKAKQRAVAKTVNFSIIYGISAYGLSQDLDTSVGEAKRYIEEYHEQYPGVKRFMDGQIAAAKEQGYVETLFGRRRYIEELKSQNFSVRQFGERAAMNTPVQGTAADIIRMAMLNAEDTFAKAHIDAGMVSQVHDELIFEVREDQAEAVAQLLKQAMEEVVSLKVPLKAEVAIGQNWFDAKQ